MRTIFAKVTYEEGKKVTQWKTDAPCWKKQKVGSALLPKGIGTNMSVHRRGRGTQTKVKRGNQDSFAAKHLREKTEIVCCSRRKIFKGGGRIKKLRGRRNTQVAVGR